MKRFFRSSDTPASGAMSVAPDGGVSNGSAVVRRPGGSFLMPALIVYLALITYASWYPFSGWRSNGLSAWSYLDAPLPYYWTGFDVVTNIVGYLPLGFLLAWAFARRLPWWAALLLACLAGTFWSGLMEAVQTYLPTRVSSNLDLLTNSGGTIAGALTAIALRPFIPAQHRLYAWRYRTLHDAVGYGLMLIMLWPLSQIAPQSHLFGLGQFTTLLSDWLNGWSQTPIDTGGLLLGDMSLTPEQYWLSETVITACSLTGALLMGVTLMRRRAPRWRAVALLLLLTFAIKSMASALLFEPVNAFVWLTPGAVGGLLIGLLMTGGLLYAPQKVQRHLAVLLLAIAIVIVNVIPDNPYFTSSLQTWALGKFLNFNGAAQFIALIWPYMAIWFLLRRGPRH